MSVPLWTLQVAGVSIVLVLLVIWPATRALQSPNNLRNDVVLAYVAFCSRLFVAVVNMIAGPLPGAEVDAVSYVLHAQDIQGLRSVGELVSLEDPRFTAAAIVGAIARLLQLDVEITFALFNALLTAGAALTVLRIVSMFDLDAKTQFHIALISVMFPQSILYTAVPLREAAILLLFTQVMWWSSLRIMRSARLSDPRLWLALPALMYLHSGFVALVPMLIGVLSMNHKSRLRNISLHKVLIRGAVPGLVALVLLAPFLGKIPSNPSELFSLDTLQGLRRRKASYGDGYLAATGASPLEFVVQIPAMLVVFITAPFPYVSFSGAGLYKLIDGALTTAAVVGLVREWRRRSDALTALQVTTIRAWVVGLAGLWFFFAIGTANIGIAIRHRNKMIWLVLLTYLILRAVRIRSERSAAEVDEGIGSAVSA